MKFDKETIIVFVICMILLVSVDPIFRHMGWLPQNPQQTTQTKPEAEKKSAETVKAKSESTASAETKAKTPPKVVEKPKNIPKLPPRTIGDELTELKIDPNFGTVTAITLKKFLKFDRKEKVVLDKEAPTGALDLFGPNKWDETVIESNLIAPNVYSLTRKITDGDKSFFLIQKWTVNGYVTDYVITIRNTGDKPLEFDWLYVSAGAMPTLNDLTGDKARNLKHLIGCMTTNGKYIDMDVDDKKKDYDNFATGESLQWISVSNKYFTSIFKADKPFQPKVLRLNFIDKEDKDKESYVGSIGASWKGLKVAAKDSLVLKAQCYNGPKEMDLMKKFDPSTIESIHLAWGPIGWIARFLLALLAWLHGMCGSWGWSIIILTLIVRGLLWPLTQKANRSMKRMQKLKPEIDKINEQYADNPQMKNTKVMQLYRDHKINPVGGCLPILLQIPIFLALYNTLDGTVQLRQVAFLWANDLTMPDTVASIFGLDINPLVLAMTGLMLVQQKMMPTPADAMQQKMMMFMPVVMLFFLYSLPSGLTLYWTVSQICSIGQMYINQKLMKDPDEEPAPKKA